MGDARGIGCNDDQGGNDLQEEDDQKDDDQEDDDQGAAGQSGRKAMVKETINTKEDLLM